MQVVKGNLFAYPCTVRVQCIAQDARMGAGIAVQFVRRYPNLRSHVLSMRPDVGSCVYYKDPNGEIVLNLITKKFSNGKPTYESLRDSLLDMVRVCSGAGIKHVAMPTIGCGLDGLNWTRVSAMIDEVCKELNVTVCML